MYIYVKNLTVLNNRVNNRVETLGEKRFYCI